MPTKLVRCIEHDTELMNRGWEIGIEAEAYLVSAQSQHWDESKIAGNRKERSLGNTKLKVGKSEIESAAHTVWENNVCRCAGSATLYKILQSVLNWF